MPQKTQKQKANNGLSFHLIFAFLITILIMTMRILLIKD